MHHSRRRRGLSVLVHVPNITLGHHAGSRGVDRRLYGLRLCAPEQEYDPVRRFDLLHGIPLGDLCPHCGVRALAGSEAHRRCRADHLRLCPGRNVLLDAATAGHHSIPRHAP